MNELMKKIGFNKEEQAFFADLYSKLNEDNLKEFDELKKVFMMTDTPLSQAEAGNYVNERLIAIAKELGCHEYSLFILFLLYCCGDLKKQYEKAGVSSEYYQSVIEDITCKLRECNQVHSIMGTTSLLWFHNHFLMKLFSLGRFQYAKGPFTGREDYCFGDVCLKRGDSVYYVHIPSTGPMTESLRLDSYKKAYEFFGKNHGDYIVLVCESWLLYPENKFIFPEKSNMMGFLNDFDVIKSHVSENPFPNAWRVFNRNYDGDTSVLPCNTTLQKNYIKWLEAGNKVGNGYGVIFFDGEKIVNKK